MTARLVVVEDDPSVAELVTLYLRNAGFIVAHARTAAEARVKFELGYALGGTRPRGPTLELGAGYASGNFSTGLNTGASSTNWHATIAAPFPDLPVQGFVRYSGYTNEVGRLGTVWTEHAVTGGIQINLGCQCEKSLEPMMPLPFMLRTVMTF